MPRGVFEAFFDWCADIRYRKCTRVRRVLPSGLDVRLFYSPKQSRVVFFQLRRGETYRSLGIVDTYHGVAFDPLDKAWRQLSDAKGDLRNARLPYDFKYDRKGDCVIYTLDGEVFSLPLESIGEIEGVILAVEQELSGQGDA